MLITNHFLCEEMCIRDSIRDGAHDNYNVHIHNNDPSGLRIVYVFLRDKMCIRDSSNSDKQTLYRDENELVYVKEADPLMKVCRMLLRYKRLTEEELQQIEAAAKKELASSC